MLPPLEKKTSKAAQEIGAQMKEAREAAGISQKSLAESIGMTRTSYARLEKGQTNITIDSLVRVAEGLGLNVEVVFTRRK